MDDDNRDLVERIFQNAQFVQSLGIELTSSGKGYCETRVRIAPSHRQQHGFIHAGVLMTLADHTCGGAAATTIPKGRDVITVENKISFLRPASGDELTCRAQVLRAGKNLVFVEAELMTNSDKGIVLVAKASSTLAVIPLNTEPQHKPGNVKIEQAE
ncbi:MAG TPA: PaaI family thioesterase [Terriglobales bacterium]|jgi:uncharacterized protein (TIGR00369 family)